jgi:hypothetical protein
MKEGRKERKKEGWREGGVLYVCVLYVTKYYCYATDIY